MRLLLIIPTLDRHGAEKQLTLLASALPRAELDVHVCTLTRGGPYEAALREAGVPVASIGKRWKVDPGAWLRLRRHIRRLAPDLVHTWIFAANCYGRHAAWSAGVRRVVASERCADRWKRPHELWLDRRLARRTDRIIANSGGVVDFYVRRGLPAEKFVVIPNGVEPIEPGGEAERRALLEQLGLPPEAKLIAAVGRLWPQKRIHDLIWAADLLQALRDDTHLLILGDGPLRERLERYRRLTHTERCVHFLGHREDAARIVAQCHCLWLASGYEGQSNAILEAMAAGVPVVATDIPGNRDLVLSDQTGFLVPVGDRAAFARQTNWLLEHPEQARAMGQAGRRRAREAFSVERMAARHAAVYRELVEG